MGRTRGHWSEPVPVCQGGAREGADSLFGVRGRHPGSAVDRTHNELQYLAAANPAATDTTLLIHPFVFADFLDYNDFLEVADAAIAELKLDGVMQIASFHPHYQFADTRADDISNFTNRSPYPTLHLLREASVARAVEAFPDAVDIFEKNIETMTKLGHSGWEKMR